MALLGVGVVEDDDGSVCNHPKIRMLLSDQSGELNHLLQRGG